MKSAKTSKAISSNFYNQFLNSRQESCSSGNMQKSPNVKKPPLKQFINTQNSTQLSSNVRKTKGSVNTKFSLLNPVILSPTNEDLCEHFSVKNLQSFSRTCRNSNQMQPQAAKPKLNKQLSKYKSFNEIEHHDIKRVK